MSVCFFDFLEDTGFVPSLYSQCLDSKRFLTVLSFKIAFISNIKFAFTKAVFKTLFRDTLYLFSCIILETTSLFYSFHHVEQLEFWCAVPPLGPFPLPPFLFWSLSQGSLSPRSLAHSFFKSQIYLLFLCPIFMEPRCPTYLLLWCTQATTNPTFAHLTIYFPVSHFPLPHNGPKIPVKIKILSSLVAVWSQETLKADEERKRPGGGMMQKGWCKPWEWLDSPLLAFKLEAADYEPKNAGSLQNVKIADKKVRNSVLQPQGTELCPTAWMSFTAGLSSEPWEKLDFWIIEQRASWAMLCLDFWLNKRL